MVQILPCAAVCWSERAQSPSSPRIARTGVQTEQAAGDRRTGYGLTLQQLADRLRQDAVTAPGREHAVSTLWAQFLLSLVINVMSF
jgi:hypothetical protein